MYKQAILAMLLLVISGCNLPYFLGPVPVVVPDRDTLPSLSLFQSSDCSTGCWENLRPGQSSSQEVEAFFETNVDYNPQGFRLESSTEGVVTYNGTHQNGFSLSMFVEEDTLLDIELYGPFNVTLSEIIDRLSEPVFVDLSIRHSSVGPSRYDVVFRVFYPEEGYIFDFGQISGIEVREVSSEVVEFCLGEDVLVWRAHFVQPGTIQSVLQDLRPSLFRSWTDDNLNAYADELDTGFDFGCTEVLLGE